MSWSITKEKTKEKRSSQNSFPLVGDSKKSNRVFWKVYAWLGCSVKVGTLFFTKSVKFGFGELSIGWIYAESRDLGPEHGFSSVFCK